MYIIGMYHEPLTRNLMTGVFVHLYCMLTVVFHCVVLLYGRQHNNLQINKSILLY
jgi:hypothetical protein